MQSHKKAPENLAIIPQNTLQDFPPTPQGNRSRMHPGFGHCFPKAIAQECTQDLALFPQALCQTCPAPKRASRLWPRSFSYFANPPRIIPRTCQGSPSNLHDISKDSPRQSPKNAPQELARIRPSLVQDFRQDSPRQSPKNAPQNWAMIPQSTLQDFFQSSPRQWPRNAPPLRVWPLFPHAFCKTNSRTPQCSRPRMPPTFFHDCPMHFARLP